MKLLFDENISHKLADNLSDLFPGSTHVRNVGLKSAEDLEVWDYAKDNDYMIVSKDSDMHDRSFVFGYPPKVVWIRLGNCSTIEVENLLRRRFELINEFHKDEYSSFLAIS